jgi:hypothetical protein
MPDQLGNVDGQRKEKQERDRGEEKTDHVDSRYDPLLRKEEEKTEFKRRGG